jgi:protoporphyrinogen oxidase
MAAEFPYAVLGGGLAGLSAAAVLGGGAVTFERSSRPGGLVKTERFGEYWFDHVLHLLYFDNPQIRARMLGAFGGDFAKCEPVAWVETRAGKARFPVQFHLGGCDLETQVATLSELAELTYGPPRGAPGNFREMLMSTFGKRLCEVFFFPYNRKVWKRHLSGLQPGGFTWNITPVEFRKALRGALAPGEWLGSYNQDGWYPRPPPTAAVRGMEVLSRRMAASVPNLLLEHSVRALDVDRRLVTVRHGGRDRHFRYSRGCCSTLPLPTLARLCRQTPARLRRHLHLLKRNRVLTVALSIQGPRPSDMGLWRYYASGSVPFTRLIFMHEFDPLNAPPDGWGMMAEMVERAEQAPPSRDEVFGRVRGGLEQVGALPRDCRIVDQHLVVIDPAYVVFSDDSQDLADEARSFFERRGVTLEGRFGRWVYTSMAQTVESARAWAEGSLDGNGRCGA